MLHVGAPARLKLPDAQMTGRMSPTRKPSRQGMSCSRSRRCRHRLSGRYRRGTPLARSRLRCSSERSDRWYSSSARSKIDTSPRRTGCNRSGQLWQRSTRAAGKLRRGASEGIEACGDVHTACCTLSTLEHAGSARGANARGRIRIAASLTRDGVTLPAVQKEPAGHAVHSLCEVAPMALR